MNWTLQHPMSCTCCCGALREEQLAKLFIEGTGSIDLMPNEEINHVQFNLQIALTGLLTLAGKAIRDRLVVLDFPNKDINNIQFKMQLALTGLLTLASNVIRDQLVELRVQNEETALLSQTEEEQLHLLSLTNFMANPDTFCLIRNF